MKNEVIHTAVSITNKDIESNVISLNEINKAEQYPDYYPEEYEQWSNMGNDSSLTEDLYSPCGSAANTTDMANHITYDRGSK